MAPPTEAELLTRYTTLLTTPESIYSEFTNRSMYFDYPYNYSREDRTKVPVNKWTIGEVIVALHKLKYEFTREEFDKFIDRACRGKSKAYIATKSRINEKAQNKAIIILFTKFTPTAPQLKKILGCYEKLDANCFAWIKPLIDTGYTFTKSQKDVLLKFGLCTATILDPNHITIDELVLMSKEFNSFQCAEYKKIITDNTIIPTTELLTNIIISTNKNVDIDFVNWLMNAGAMIDITIIEWLLRCPPNLCSHNYGPIFDSIKIPFDVITRFYFHPMCLYALFTQYEPSEQTLEFMINHDFNSAHYKIIASMFPELKLLDVVAYEASDNELEMINTYLETPQSNYINFESFTALIGLIHHLHRNIMPTQNTMSQACKQCDVHLMRVLESHFGILPTKQDLDIVVSISEKYYRDKNITDTIIEILNNRIQPDQTTAIACSKANKTNIMLLMQHGMNGTPDILQHLLESENNDNDEFLDIDPEKFGLDYDEELYYICHQANNMPPDWFNKFMDNIPQNTLLLRHYFKTHKNLNHEDILNACAKFSANLDMYCLESLCWFSPYEAYKIIKDDNPNLVPSVGCLYNAKEHKLQNIICERLSNKLQENSQTYTATLDFK